MKTTGLNAFVVIGYSYRKKFSTGAINAKTKHKVFIQTLAKRKFSQKLIKKRLDISDGCSKLGGWLRDFSSTVIKA